MKDHKKKMGDDPTFLHHDLIESKALRTALSEPSSDHIQVLQKWAKDHSVEVASEGSSLNAAMTLAKVCSP